MIAGTLVRNKVHVALFALIATWAWGRLTSTSILRLDLVVVPLLVFATYQWNRLTDRVEDAVNCPDDLADALRAPRLITLVSFAATALALILALVSGRHGAAALAAGCQVSGILYGVPLGTGPRPLRLKSHFVLKNATGALGWTVLTVVYPGVHAGAQLGVPIGLAAIVMFFSVWTVEIVWDVRDAEGDRRAALKTLPVLRGIAGARRVVHGMNLVTGLLLVTAVAAGLVPPLWLAGLLNLALISAWLAWLGADAARIWSHVLVLIESVSLLGLGLLAGRPAVNLQAAGKTPERTGAVAVIAVTCDGGRFCRGSCGRPPGSRVPGPPAPSPSCR
jgi:4-hydroxybenzoate polyprenyltransferase